MRTNYTVTRWHEGGISVASLKPSGEQPDMGISRELVKAMAADVGKSLAAYVEVMFPEIWHGSNSGFKISIRNHVHNDIVSMADLHDEAAIRKRLADNESFRKRWVGGYRKMRRKKARPVAAQLPQPEKP